MAGQSEQKRYAVLAEGTGLHIRYYGNIPHLTSGADVKLSHAGNINYSPEMWERVIAKQRELPYFSSEKELEEARKRGFKGGWNMPKASVVSVGVEEKEQEHYFIDEQTTKRTINIGYSLWVTDPSGIRKPMKVDYAAASISRGEMPGFAENPLDMYALNSKGVYVKNNNDYPNVLGSFALVVLDANNKGKKPQDLEVLLVQRGDYKEIEHLQGTWTFPGGYTEPEYRLKLTPQFMENDILGEIREEGAIKPKEVERLMPVAFLQDEYETAFLWLAFTHLTASEVMERKIHSEIEKRNPVVVKELDDFVSAHYFDPASKGALAEVLNSEKLIGRYLEPVQFFAQRI